MPEWINGGGFYLVQATEPYCKDKLKREMAELRLKLEEAERYWVERKGQTA